MKTFLSSSKFRFTIMDHQNGEDFLLLEYQSLLSQSSSIIDKKGKKRETKVFFLHGRSLCEANKTSCQRNENDDEKLKHHQGRYSMTRCRSILLWKSLSLSDDHLRVFRYSVGFVDYGLEYHLTFSGGKKTIMHFIAFCVFYLDLRFFIIFRNGKIFATFKKVFQHNLK